MKKHQWIKKWLITGTLVIGLLAALVGCIRVVFQGTMYPGLNVRASLIVNNIEIPKTKARIFQRGDSYYGELPVFAVLTQLGYSVEWESDEIALISISEKNYEYQDGRIFLREENTDYQTPKKEKAGVEVIRSGKELYALSYEYPSIMEKLGISIDISIDPDSRAIYITSPVDTQATELSPEGHGDWSVATKH